MIEINWSRRSLYPEHYVLKWKTMLALSCEMDPTRRPGQEAVKGTESSSSTAESNSEDESLKLFIETDAKCSLPLIL